MSPIEPMVSWVVRSRSSVAPAAVGPADVVVLSGCDATRLSRAVALTAAGLRVVAVGSIQAARAALVPGVGCLVVDRRAPDGDALALVDELYRTEGAPSVVVVTTHESERERVESLVAGAEDVVPPQISARELVARVRRLAAPPPSTPCRREPPRLTVGRVTIDQDRRSVRVDGTEVALSPTQYQILVSLVVERGRAITVRALFDRCWDTHQDQASCAVRTQITRLRRALRGAVEISCVRGEGYRLAAAEG
ncbi:MAG TPA: response regulator transcription factor [Iamia sp.]